MPNPIPHPAATDDTGLILLQGELAQIKSLVQEYGRLDAGVASDTDLGARAARIGGRMQAIVQFERELMLPRLDDGVLQRRTEAQVEDVLQHIEALAAQSAEQQSPSSAEMLALASHFEAHMQWLLNEVWPSLEQHEHAPMEEELAEWRARWRQEEAAD